MNSNYCNETTNCYCAGGYTGKVNHNYTKTVQLTWLQRIKAMFTGKLKVILNGQSC